MTRKIDITSTALEKGIDLAKDFLDKLIIPTIEETGLLLKDKVTVWRFNNQIKMLIKAKQNCEKHGINPKTISLKILCPLLDYAGLEEDAILQNKWANLLTNMVDSSNNIENHVFPYLLSQVSVDEFIMIEAVNKIRVERVTKKEKELEEFLNVRANIEKEIKDQISILNQQIKDNNDQNSRDFDLHRKMWVKESDLKELENKERGIRNAIKQPELIPNNKLKEYEVSNLIRLGIIKIIPKSYAYVGEHKIQNNPDSEYLYLHDLVINVESEEDDLVLTELGELFISACNEKNINKF